MTASRTLSAKALFRLVGAANLGDADAARQVRGWCVAFPDEARHEARRNFRLKKFLPTAEDIEREAEKLF